MRMRIVLAFVSVALIGLAGCAGKKAPATDPNDSSEMRGKLIAGKHADEEKDQATDENAEHDTSDNDFGLYDEDTYVDDSQDGAEAEPENDSYDAYEPDSSDEDTEQYLYDDEESDDSSDEDPER